MTESDPKYAPPQRVSRIRLPGIATAMLALSPFLLFLGFLIFMGSSTRGYFERAPFQATLGIVVFLTGVLFLTSALVLAGVRTIAQRHIEVLAQTKGSQIRE